MAYDEEKMNRILNEVKNRISVSAEKYKDAYVVNNMTKELNDEFYDIVGWMAMMSYRMIEASEKVIYKFDNIYWDKFLQNQETDFLIKMASKIRNELIQRKNDAVVDIKNVLQEIQEETKKEYNKKLLHDLHPDICHCDEPSIRSVWFGFAEKCNKCNKYIGQYL
jgi:uncharacterized protein YdiU (UPF0061 family)